ncbi:kinetochore Sim4 complex subunit Fta4 [Daldinia vernicosa]|uniref:kinetochore Sim4 complex subunit Fta4 n=1 Tax=Daldinia vernicosa TaxID=114800 RepID=UPI002008DC5D|nr:kinetochore Sim4 complex subunit Fta4 [Daldinia vernicosa]KAI0847003.1 kinetochore Sim4 complex subunit Fta4 [Daldinia vernicosa]
MAPPTILAHKSSFLTAQTLHLSQSLVPSNTWRTSNQRIPENGGSLSDRVVDEVLYRANHILQQHARRVYAPQASRHVAEQIETLYLEAAERAVRGEGSRGEDDDDGVDAGDGLGGGGPKFLMVGADFASDEVIASLPNTWDQHSPSQSEAHPAEALRYADLATSLSILSSRRKETRARLDRLRRMRTLLVPFSSTTTTTTTSSSAIDSSNPQSSNGANEVVNSASESGVEKVQPNLVTRDGEMEKELERMRVLLVRVAARVAQLPDPEPGEDVAMEDLEAVERGKVERLLDGF